MSLLAVSGTTRLKSKQKLIGVQTRWALGFGKSSSASSKIMALLTLGEPEKCTRDGNGIFHSFALAKNMALLPLGELKIGTENDLAPRTRKSLSF